MLPTCCQTFSLLQHHLQLLYKDALRFWGGSTPCSVGQRKQGIQGHMCMASGAGQLSHISSSVTSLPQCLDSSSAQP